MAIDPRVFDKKWRYKFLKEIKVIKEKLGVQDIITINKRDSFLGKTGSSKKGLVKTCPVGHALVYKKTTKLSQNPYNIYEKNIFWWKFSYIALSKKRCVLKYSLIIRKKVVKCPVGHA